MEIDSDTDASRHLGAGHRGRFGPSHSLPPLATGPHSQPAHSTSIQSAGSFSTSPAVGSLQQLQDQKRPRACKSCRGLKVRCEPNTDDPSKQCKRCAKANRECVFTAPSRKRQKKADTKVAELEKKIDALMASLDATKQMAARESQEEDDDEEDYEDETPREAVVEAAAPSPVSARPSKRQKESDDSRAQQRLRNDPEEYSVFPSFLAPKGSKIPVSTHIKPVEGSEHQHEYMDVIRRQLLGIEMARQIFDHYVEDLVPHFPAVVFPPGTTADEVRKEKPTLFLAILASASRMSHPDLHHALHKEISQALADKIMINGEKSLEIIQALLVTAVWYYPPEHIEELKYYMHTHQAAAMAVELGLGRKTVLSKPRALGIWSMPRTIRPAEHTGPHGVSHGSWIPGPGETHPLPGDRKHGFPKPPPKSVLETYCLDSSTLESRRTLLACYWTCCNVAMTRRRPNMLRFTPFMAECVQDLETNPKAAKTDISLANLVKVQRIAEDVGNEFAFDRADAVVDLQEERVQTKLQEFNRKLKTWKDELPEKARHPQLEMSFHIVSIYTNEIALHNNHNVDHFRPPYAESLLRPPFSSQPLTALRINAIKTCMFSADTVISTFLDLPLISARSLPMFDFLRCSYVCVVLLTIYFTAWSPESRLGEYIDRNSLEIAQSLERLSSKLEKMGEEDKCRGARTFIPIMEILRNWYLRRSKQLGGAPAMPVGPAAGLSQLHLSDPSDGKSGMRVGGMTGSLSMSRDPAPMPLRNSNYSHDPRETISISPGGSTYFIRQQQQDPFLPPPPPQPPEPQPLVRTPATPGYNSTREWIGATTSPEQLVFTGNGEMFPDDNYWALMDGNIGVGALDWSYWL